MKKEAEQFLNNYKGFVDGVTSSTSKNTEDLIKRIIELDENGCDPARLLTAGIGLPGEAGEFSEIVKKVLFHGKAYDDAVIAHLKKELGDSIWYWMQACLAIGLNPVEVIEENVEKLEARYPGGKFDIASSEHRADGDI